jgi:cysteine desulfurase
MEPSHVLTAMGVNRTDALSSLRLSLGWSSTDAEVDHAASAVIAAVARLRDAAQTTRREQAAVAGTRGGG